MWLIRIASRGEVHRVHLGELRLAEQVARGAHQRAGQRVALGAEAVALGHQGRGGRERQAREAAVLGDRAEVGASRRRSRRRRGRPGSPSCMRAWSSRSSALSRGSISKRAFSYSISALHLARRRPPRRRGRSRPGASESICGPSVAQEAVLVDADVAHAVHRVAEDRDLEAAPAGDRRGRARPLGRPPSRNSRRVQSPVTTWNGRPARTIALAVSCAPWMPWL